MKDNADIAVLIELQLTLRLNKYYKKFKPSKTDALQGCIFRITQNQPHCQIDAKYWGFKNQCSTPLEHSIKYFWGTFEVLLEYFWGTFGVLLEYFWSTFGVLLERFWSIFGLLFGQFCSTFEILLEYFTSSWHIL